MNTIDSWINAFYLFLQSLGYPHPAHSAVVHLPIGLIFGAFVLGWIALLFRRQNPARAAWFAIIVAFVVFFPVALLGLMDWQHFYGGAWLLPIKVKLYLAAFLLVLLVATLALGRQGHRAALVPLYTLCFLTVIGLGYFGGQLIYGGRMPPPPPPQFQEGAQIFRGHCSACHPNGDNAIEFNMPLKTSDRLDSLHSFVSWIRDPKSPMPTFGPQKISKKKAEELYRYIIHTWGKPGEQEHHATHEEGD
jgi:uncharacterized membrane protein